MFIADKLQPFIPLSSMIYPISLLPTPCCLVSNENYLVEDKLSCVYIIMTLPSSTKLLTPDIYSKFTNTFLQVKFSLQLFSCRVPEGLMKSIKTLNSSLISHESLQKCFLSSYIKILWMFYIVNYFSISTPQYCTTLGTHQEYYTENMLQ